MTPEAYFTAVNAFITWATGIRTGSGSAAGEVVDYSFYVLWFSSI
jgi:hypothetical protein